MLDKVAFTDLRGYIKKRIVSARYRVGTEYFAAQLNDISILADGTVKAQLAIIPGDTVTVNRVELFNNDRELWAHQDVNITLTAGQTGILYWFDFSITEKKEG